MILKFLSLIAKYSSNNIKNMVMVLQMGLHVQELPISHQNLENNACLIAKTWEIPTCKVSCLRASSKPLFCCISF